MTHKQSKYADPKEVLIEAKIQLSLMHFLIFQDYETWGSYGAARAALAEFMDIIDNWKGNGTPMVVAPELAMRLSIVFFKMEKEDATKRAFAALSLVKFETGYHIREWLDAVKETGRTELPLDSSVADKPSLVKWDSCKTDSHYVEMRSVEGRLELVIQNLTELDEEDFVMQFFPTLLDLYKGLVQGDEDTLKRQGKLGEVLDSADNKP